MLKKYVHSCEQADMQTNQNARLSSLYSSGLDIRLPSIVSKQGTGCSKKTSHAGRLGHITSERWDP